MSPEISKLVRSLKGSVWDRQHRGNGHVLLTKGRLSFTCAATPSDGRAIQNFRAAIRRKERQDG